MAWTTPRTWVAEELVTATMMNTHVRDNLNALRDYLLGAQDLGANWLISTGRELRMSDPDVAHGMTSQLPTDVYGKLAPFSGLTGGLSAWGFSDTDATAFEIFAAIGTATPTATVPTIAFNAAKKNGTTVQALANGELMCAWQNAGTAKTRLYGDGSINVMAGGMAVGFEGVPSADRVAVGDSLFYMGFDIVSGEHGHVFDAGDYAVYNRSSNTYKHYIGDTVEMSLAAGGLTVTNLITAESAVLTVGQCVGFSGTPAADEVQVGDADFKMDWLSSTDVRLQLSSGVFLRQDRSAGSNFQFHITSLPGDDIASQITTFGFSGLNGAAVASAAAIVPTGNVFHVTGTTNITSITSTNVPAGTVITLIFDGILTFTDGSNLKLAGNFVTTADDTITLVFDGTNWYECGRSVN